MEKEVWKDIEGYEGLYKVSNYGRVKSFKCSSEKILNPSPDKYGYLRVTLRKGNKNKCAKVHRLVAEHFLSKIEGKNVVNHKDEVKSNNQVDNLEWCSTAYNNSYGTRLNRVSETQMLSILQFNQHGQLIKEWRGGSECTSYGFSQGAISMCCQGKSKHHKGYIWRYKKDVSLIDGEYKIDPVFIKKENKSQMKKVLQFDLNGNLIKEWSSVSECSQSLNIDLSSIAKCCRGEKKTYKAFIWKYKNKESDVNE